MDKIREKNIKLDEGSFKLIAIRPLMGCHQRFLKNLQGGELYTFYKDYKFFNSEGKNANLDEDVSSIVYKPTVPENLFNIRKKNGERILVNISAIVGKNGSGKSTISELLLYSLFIISNNLGFVNKENFLETSSPNEEDFGDIMRFDKDLKEISKGFQCELYYLLKDKFYKLKFYKNKIETYSSDCNLENPFVATKFQKDLKDFFYTIIVNYSFYAFNSNQIGVWINSFFHKNDGYQMPVVINPFRNEGNMDVNVENLLTRDRLLANILSIPSYRRINSKSEIDKIELYFNKNKDRRFLSNGELRFTERFVLKFRNLVLIPLFSKTFNNERSYPSIDSSIKKFAEIYLISKLLTIPNRYKSFEQFNKRKRKKESQDNYELTQGIAEAYVKELYEDRSHITLKVRQTLNFLRENIYEIPNELNFKQVLQLNSIVKKVDNLRQLDWFTETIDYLPPPFLFSRIKFKDGSYFEDLSSGERQKISSLNSIVYHLKNLDSIHKNPERNKAKGIIAYESVNLLFDEIELYYHPEFQKSTIADLLSLIREASLGFIKYINIIFLTHSPFILSDIPSQNTILLNINSKTGRSKQILNKMQSFGANIHDLFATNFFLGGTLIGEHADEKITCLIKEIKQGKNSKDNSKLLNLIGDTFLKSSIEQFEENYDKDSNR